MKVTVYLTATLLLCTGISAQELIPEGIAVSVTASSWKYVVQGGATYPAVTFTVDNMADVKEIVYDFYNNDVVVYSGLTTKDDFGDASEFTIVFTKLTVCQGMEIRIRVKDTAGNIVAKSKLNRFLACAPGALDMCVRCAYSTGIATIFDIARTTCAATGIGYNVIGALVEENYNNKFLFESSLMFFNLKKDEVWTDYKKVGGSFTYSNGETELDASIDASAFNEDDGDCSVFFVNTFVEATKPVIKATSCTDMKKAVCVQPILYSEAESTTAFVINDEHVFF